MERVSRDQLFPNRWLKADDVPAMGVDVTIVDGVTEEVDFGRGPQNVLNLTFSELDKPLNLNSTNYESIVDLYGDDNTTWVGKRIRLYRTKTRNPQGVSVPCIRIMPPTVEKVTAQATAPAAPAGTPSQEAADLAEVKAMIEKHAPSSNVLQSALGYPTVRAAMEAGMRIGTVREKLTALYAAAPSDDMQQIAKDIPF